MTLEYFYFLSQIIAAVAVVISLVYLAIQVRQSTVAVRASTVHEVEEGLRTGFSQAVQSNELGSLLWKGSREPTSLTGPERLRFYGIWNNLIHSYEDAFFQQTSNALDAQVWSAMERQLTDLMTLEGVQSYWRDRCHWYTDDFRAYIEKNILPRAADTSHFLPDA